MCFMCINVHATFQATDPHCSHHHFNFTRSPSFLSTLLLFRYSSFLSSSFPSFFYLPHSFSPYVLPSLLPYSSQPLLSFLPFPFLPFPSLPFLFLFSHSSLLLLLNQEPTNTSVSFHTVTPLQSTMASSHCQYFPLPTCIVRSLHCPLSVHLLSHCPIHLHPPPSPVSMQGPVPPPAYSVSPLSRD